MHFGITEKPTTDYVSLSLISKVYEFSAKTLKIAVVDNPTVV